jgi:hypothetical protein
MTVLLDECIPRKLKRVFHQHECATVPELGFAGRKNGVLLSLAEDAGFDVLFTIDRGIQFQQNISGRNIAILVVRARSNRLADLLPLMPQCLLAISSIQPGQVIRISE